MLHLPNRVCQRKGGAKVLYLICCMVSDLELLTEKYTTNYTYCTVNVCCTADIIRYML